MWHRPRLPRLFGIARPEQAIDLLRWGETCRVDIGSLHFRDPAGLPRTRFFVNMADIGLGAETAAWVSHSTKQLGGFLAYLVGATRTILRHRAAPLSITVDGRQVFEGPALMVAIANGRFHAGGMRLAPMASVTDGRLEVFVLRSVSRLELLSSSSPPSTAARMSDIPPSSIGQAIRFASRQPSRSASR